MPDQTDAVPPPEGGWQMLKFGPFENLTGPLFGTSQGLAADEPARIGFRVAAKHCNASGIAHGGMIATFLDMALGVAMRAATQIGAASPTMTLTVDFLRGAQTGDWIESRARLIHTTYRTAFCDVIALGPNGPIARGNAIFRLTRPK